MQKNLKRKGRYQEEIEQRFGKIDRRSQNAPPTGPGLAAVLEDYEYDFLEGFLNKWYYADKIKNNIPFVISKNGKVRTGQ